MTNAGQSSPLSYSSINAVRNSAAGNGTVFGGFEPSAFSHGLVTKGLTLNGHAPAPMTARRRGERVGACNAPKGAQWRIKREQHVVVLRCGTELVDEGSEVGYRQSAGARTSGRGLAHMRLRPNPCRTTRGPRRTD